MHPAHPAHLAHLSHLAPLGRDTMQVPRPGRTSP